MHDLQAPRLDFGLLHQVFEHTNVLNFRHADNGRAVGRGFRCHLTDSIRHIVLLLPIFLMVPLTSTIGRKFQVVGAVGVDGVEQVFQVVKRYTIHHIAFL